MAELSLIYLTYRPGGIDLLAQSLINQPLIYELIVIDDFPGRPERGEAKKFLQSHGIPLRYYGPSKTKSLPDSPCGLANAMNTGAMHATSQKVIFLHDFTVLPRNAIILWARTFEENGTKALISGVGEVKEAPKPDYLGDISIWRKLSLSDIPRESRSWIPEEQENFYQGVPISFMEEINGIDERSDYKISWPLKSVVIQAKLLGYRLVVDRRLEIDLIDHRGWGKGKDIIWHAENMNPLIPYNEPGWSSRSKNLFNFTEQRGLLLQIDSGKDI